jgi:pimeloyl-ACP methyl ester carboxylesterase
MKKTSIILGIIFLLICIASLYMHKVGQGTLTTSAFKDYKIVKASEMKFQVLTMGNPSHKAVILLHGFPESAVMWKKLMSKMSQKGFYCIAPNQRGYSPEARPQKKSAYKYNLLRDDIIAIADAMKIKRFHLVTHDWGCAVGWGVAAQYPKRVLTFTALSIPHIKAFGQAYQKSKTQHKNSSYIRFFQIPVLPEFILARDDYSMLKKLYTNHSKNEIDQYISLFKGNYALSAALNWYRANYDIFKEGFTIGKVTTSTLFIWGNKDAAVDRYGVALTKNYVSGPYRFIELDAGHWLIQEKYDIIEKEILKHIRQ